ncbi:UDP-N-acetylmuramoyl-L-alanyl-D-glutamate--2,6-diaminopimelate ligase [Roseibacillus ishigakijimensis]|uniref:UDP-N-acetylmuramoyl-L-alanyl-D-glutamate--2,6-diaminopimelate ligase n=1 Tax=Roseibacillus ishigakijimensis TaxID=454146 RepID=A0A934RTT6_9BACT|nr:UDP-N-acetylmuramoyl-L-alanyl-D-glutamate--2,6-diaminopimelate ligase [Roseibacillus ishigakijimensis]MBK1835303.1 UDP-N-acetylmuramoyl-L-alanyl-D-glutamate--2,6-diaminopimelate ligase [Roseibacillus ishigakijimensis]
MPKARITGPSEGVVGAVIDDSRQATPGCLFVAVKGAASDGHSYIPAVMAAGASVIVAEEKPREDFTGTWIQVSDSRRALAALADLQAGSPSADLNLIGITGTNGKTTIAYLVHGILNKLRRRTGMIGTIQVDDGSQVRPATHTTPGAIELQKMLARMRDNGCHGVAMEVSSHGLEQGRVVGIDFQVGVFTNLTQDHLDYHGSMENYFAAKKLLFTSLAAHGSKRVAVVNGDDRYGAELLKDFEGRLKLVSYGFGNSCQFRAGRIKQSTKGTEFQLEARGRSYLVRMPLIGRFNVLNALAALAAVDAVGVTLRDAITALRDFTGVPGRLELAGSINGAAVFVDYAHTPDAIQNVCRTLRELEPTRLITIFGCGGDRDRGKRAPMARAAEKESDFCIVTSDNPRSEEPEAIIKEVEKGFVGSAHGSILDRRAAIRTAIEQARAGDVILVAGKGHEDYQIFKDQTVTFDDRVEVRKAIEVVDRLNQKNSKE